MRCGRKAPWFRFGTTTETRGHSPDAVTRAPRRRASSRTARAGGARRCPGRSAGRSAADGSALRHPTALAASIWSMHTAYSCHAPPFPIGMRTLFVSEKRSSAWWPQYSWAKAASSVSQRISNRITRTIRVGKGSRGNSNAGVLVHRTIDCRRSGGPDELQAVVGAHPCRLGEQVRAHAPPRAGRHELATEPARRCGREIRDSQVQRVPPPRVVREVRAPPAASGRDCGARHRATSSARRSSTSSGVEADRPASISS